MAEIASQGRVGSQGGGEATVFDTSQFYRDAYTMFNDIRERREKKELEIKKQNQAWESMMADMPDVWSNEMELVQKDVDAYNDFIIDLRSRGLDPENLDPQTSRKLRELANKVRKSTSLAKENEEYYNKAYQLMNTSKEAYDKAYGGEWLKRYAGASSQEERKRMRVEESPFKLNYSLNEFIDYTIPKETITDTGRVRTTYRDPDAHKAIILSAIEGDPAIQEMYESLKKDGEDAATFATRVAEAGQLRYPKKVDKTAPPTPRASSGGNKKQEATEGYKTGKWGDLSIVVEPTASTDYFEPGYNDMAITKNNRELDPIEGIEGGSNNGYRTIPKYKPLKFYLAKGGQEVSIKGYELDEDNNVVTDDNGNPIEVWVSYNENKTKLKSYLDGFDPLTEFKERNNSNSNYTGVPIGGFNGQ